MGFNSGFKGLTTGPQTTVDLNTVANISRNKMRSFNRNPLESAFSHRDDDAAARAAVFSPALARTY